MLSFSELITYDPIAFIFIIIGLLATLCLIGIFIYRNKIIQDSELSTAIIICGIIMIIFGGMGSIIFLTNEIVSTTITPCNILEDVTHSTYLIADISNQLYYAPPDIAARLHNNQTINALIEYVKINKYPTIINATGSFCTNTKIC